MGLVVERLDRPAGVAGRLRLLPRRGRPGGDAGPAEEADDPAVLGDRQAVGKLGQDRGPNGSSRSSMIRIAAPSVAVAAASAMSGPAAPPLTGGMQASSSPSARISVGSA